MPHRHRKQDPHSIAVIYRAAALRGAVSGAVRALITWLLEDH